LQNWQGKAPVVLGGKMQAGMARGKRQSHKEKKDGGGGVLLPYMKIGEKGYAIKDSKTSQQNRKIRCE